MEQNLLVGDHILVNKFVFAPAPTRFERALLPVRPVARGDVVVFRYPVDPARDFIKRCVALGGNEVEITRGNLILDGRAVDESGYVFHDSTAEGDPFAHYESRPQGDFGPFSVPSDSYFCLGDNRENSHDSRAWGPVPADHVRGRAVLIYWSWESTSNASRARSLIGSTRWGRTFRWVR